MLPRGRAHVTQTDTRPDTEHSPGIKVSGRLSPGRTIPSPVRGNVALGRYTGRMVKGKFQGLVVNADATGQTFHGMFLNGAKTSDWIAGSPPPPNSQTSNQRMARNATTKTATNVKPAPPAAGPPHFVAAVSPPPLAPPDVLSDLFKSGGGRERGKEPHDFRLQRANSICSVSRG